MENQLISVKGIYQDGEIVLLTPFKPIGRFKVIVTFLESDESGNSREMIQQVDNVSSRRKFQYEFAETLKLSRREMDILVLVTQGKTNNEIAENLELGQGTVRNYVSGILNKLKVDNRTELTAKVKELGLVD